MGERRILVVGSQCEALNPLSFLPQVTEEFYDVMTSPDLGACVPALGDRASSLLYNPQWEQVWSAIEAAFQSASRDEATLYLCFVGHGEQVGEDFYFLPVNGTIPPNSRTSVHLVQSVLELCRQHSNLDGLVLLLDACSSGVAAWQAEERMAGRKAGFLRFEILTASADRSSAEGCFTRNLTQIIRTGVPRSQWQYLQCAHIRALFEEEGRCPKQEPQHVIHGRLDEGLFLAKNAAVKTSSQHRTEPWAGTVAASQIEKFTRWFQVTPQLTALLDLTDNHRCVVLYGDAGLGKSSLAAALAYSQITQGTVPQNFVQAIAFLSEATTPDTLAHQLSEQLAKCLPTFTEAQLRFLDSVDDDELSKLDPISQQIIGPLRMLRPAHTVRIVLDALDALLPGAKAPILAAVRECASAEELANVRTVITSRTIIEELQNLSETDEVDQATESAIDQYLKARGVPGNIRALAVQRAGNNWLLARLVADVGGASVGSERKSLRAGDLYDFAFQEFAAEDQSHWRLQLLPVLAVLAAAGTGPILPLQLLCSASARLGGPQKPPAIRNVLAKLRAFVVRDAPGTSGERIGVFHQTLRDYLLNDTDLFGRRADLPHAALADAVEEMAPASKHRLRHTEPIFQYASFAEAEHLAMAGRWEKVLSSIDSRSPSQPSVTLALWSSWRPRLQTALGPDHPHTLRIRNNIAFWTGEAGHIEDALLLFQELLRDQQRVLGLDHRDTLRTRNNIGFWTGEAGKIEESLRLVQELLPDQQRVLGLDHADTLRSRNNIASWTGIMGNIEDALPLFQELLRDQQRVLGLDHKDTLTTRNNIAHWTGKAGNIEEALRLYSELLPDQQRLLGLDHADTLTTRNNIAFWTAEACRIEEALQLFRKLLAHQQRVLGQDHRATLTSRSNIAYWTAKAGRIEEALVHFRELLADQHRALSSDHPQTLRTRLNIAYWTGETGKVGEALRLSRELLQDQVRVLGPDHADTLKTRHNIKNMLSKSFEKPSGRA